MKHANHPTAVGAAKLAEVVECGSCNHFHPLEFNGDCRDNGHRLSIDQLDAQYGPAGWIATADNT